MAAAGVDLTGGPGKPCDPNFDESGVNLNRATLSTVNRATLGTIKEGNEDQDPLLEAIAHGQEILNQKASNPPTTNLKEKTWSQSKGWGKAAIVLKFLFGVGSAAALLYATVYLVKKCFDDNDHNEYCKTEAGGKAGAESIPTATIVGRGIGTGLVAGFTTLYVVGTPSENLVTNKGFKENVKDLTFRTLGKGLDRFPRS